MLTTTYPVALGDRHHGAHELAPVAGGVRDAGHVAEERVDVGVGDAIDDGPPERLVARDTKPVLAHEAEEYQLALGGLGALRRRRDDARRGRNISRSELLFVVVLDRGGGGGGSGGGGIVRRYTQCSFEP